MVDLGQPTQLTLISKNDMALFSSMNMILNDLFARNDIIFSWAPVGIATYYEEGKSKNGGTSVKYWNHDPGTYVYHVRACSTSTTCGSWVLVNSLTAN